MADRVFDSIEDLIKFVNNDIENVLLTKGAEKIKKIEQDVIEDKVYGVYTPKFYERRFDDKGLHDVNNMDSYLIKEGDETVLVIENDTKVSPNSYDSRRGDYLDKIIENGLGGDTPYNRARRFTEETQRIINNENIIQNVIKKSLDYME